MFNIAEIVQNQIPDENGNLIPPSVHEGSAMISGAHAENEHILVAMDGGIYNVQKATCHYYCNNCNGMASSSIAILGFAVGPTGTVQMSLKDTWNTGVQHDLTNISSWSSSQTSIATVTTTGTARGKVTGVAAGDVTVNGSNLTEPWAGQVCGSPPPSCPPDEGVEGSGSGTVQTPTYFGPTGYEPVSCDCESGQVGAGCIEVQYQVLDQNGSPMQVSGITPQELACVAEFNPSCQTTYSQFSTPPITAGTGTFLDIPVGTCFVNPSGNQCVHPTQQFQAALNGQTHSVTTLTVRSDCYQGEQDQIYGNPAGYNQTYKYGTIN